MTIDKEKELPKRKSTRLKNFDYGSAGAYFVTICIRDRMRILSEIVNTDLKNTDKAIDCPVREGLAPPAFTTDKAIGCPVREGLALSAFTTDKTIGCPVGEGLAPPEFTTKLKPCGEIVKEQLQLIETRFPGVTVKDYVIMPDHIHAVIFLRETAGGASPSPTLNDVICAFKSLTSRSCKQKYGIEKMFQRSYAEHIIRDREDLETRRKYIYENPIRWYYKNFHAEE